MRLLNTLNLSILSLLLILGASFSLAQAEFKELKPGYEIGDFTLSDGIFAAEYVAIRLDPKRWKIEAYLGKSAMSAKEAAESAQAVVAINANFFGKDLKPLGLIVSDGNVLHQLQLGGKTLTGIFLIEGERAKIIHREQYTQTEDVTQAVQAGPRLVADGKALTSSDEGSTRRSAVGVDGNGRVVLIASKNRIPGLSLAELQRIAGELGLKDALNLDGGGSSQLYVSKEMGREVEVSGGDKVPAFLVVRE